MAKQDRSRAAVAEEVEAEDANTPSAQPDPQASAGVKLDETTPGGAYFVNGVKVNAEGEPIQ